MTFFVSMQCLKINPVLLNLLFKCEFLNLIFEQSFKMLENNLANKCLLVKFLLTHACVIVNVEKYVLTSCGNGNV